MSISNNQFKRLSIGDRFTHKGARYRKCSGTQAFALKPNGVGETHAKIKFSRSAAVDPVVTPRRSTR